MLAAFEQDGGLPARYRNILSAKSLSPEHILTFDVKYYISETALRSRFKKFVSRNKNDFDGVIDYVANEKSIDVDIKILDNQHLKACTFDTFHSKTGGKFCVVTVAELIAELFGKAADVEYGYVNQRVRHPPVTGRSKLLAMFTPAMCNASVNSGAELYTKLFLDQKSRSAFSFLNIPLGPQADDSLRRGVEVTEITSGLRVEAA